MRASKVVEGGTTAARQMRLGAFRDAGQGSVGVASPCQRDPAGEVGANISVLWIMSSWTTDPPPSAPARPGSVQPSAREPANLGGEGLGLFPVVPIHGDEAEVAAIRWVGDATESVVHVPGTLPAVNCTQLGRPSLSSSTLLSTVLSSHWPNAAASDGCMTLGCGSATSAMRSLPSSMELIVRQGQWRPNRPGPSVFMPPAASRRTPSSRTCGAPLQAIQNVDAGRDRSGLEIAAHCILGVQDQPAGRKYVGTTSWSSRVGCLGSNLPDRGEHCLW